MLKAVIFDLDGVIVDSEPLHLQADLLTMRDYGMELAEADFIAYVGVSGPEMWADLIGQYGIADTLDCILERQTAHKQKLLADTRLEAIPGIRELLDGAGKAGLKIGLASSSPRYFIDAVLGNLGIAGRFAAVASADDVARSKPSPDVFLKAAERLDVQPGECVVIEDSGHGVCAAKAAGMRCIGYINPTSGVQDLRRADAVVESICQIDLKSELFSK